MIKKIGVYVLYKYYTYTHTHTHKHTNTHTHTHVLHFYTITNELAEPNTKFTLKKMLKIVIKNVIKGKIDWNSDSIKYTDLNCLVCIKSYKDIIINNIQFEMPTDLD